MRGRRDVATAEGGGGVFGFSSVPIMSNDHESGPQGRGGRGHVTVQLRTASSQSFQTNHERLFRATQRGHVVPT